MPSNIPTPLQTKLSEPEGYPTLLRYPQRRHEYHQTFFFFFSVHSATRPPKLTLVHDVYMTSDFVETIIIVPITFFTVFTLAIVSVFGFLTHLVSTFFLIQLLRYFPHRYQSMVQWIVHGELIDTSTFSERSVYPKSFEKLR